MLLAHLASVRIVAGSAEDIAEDIAEGILEDIAEDVAHPKRYGPSLADPQARVTAPGAAS